MFFILEIIGTIALAISGAMTAIKAKMDVLGVAVFTVAGAGSPAQMAPAKGIEIFRR